MPGTDPLKISLPLDAADHVLGMLGMPAPGPTGMPAPNPAASQGPMALPPVMPQPQTGALPPVAPANAGMNVTAPPAKPQTGLQKFGSVLGKIGGTALDVLAPGIGAQIPQTPLGKIVQQQRDAAMQQQAEKVQSDTGLQGAQAANFEAEAAAKPQETAIAQEKADTEKSLSEKVPVTIGNQTFYVPQKDVEKLIGTQQEVAGRQGVAETAAGARTGAAEISADNKTQPTKTLMVNGQAHIMERDPSTGDYSVDRGIAPPTYAQVAPELRTVDVLNDQGIPTVQTLTGRTIGTSASGAYGHEMAQAGAVARGGDQLISDIQANKDKLGTLKSWVQKYGLNTPIADPQLAGLQAELKTFAALQPAMHGFRSRSAQEAFENIIGDVQKNPDATIASIRGILKTAGAINPSTAQLPAGAIAGTMNGKHGYVLNGEFHAE